MLYGQRAMVKHSPPSNLVNSLGKEQQFVTGKKEAGKNLSQGGGEAVGDRTVHVPRSQTHCICSIVPSDLAYKT